MRSPAEKYLKYLLTQMRSVGEALSVAKQLELTPVSTSYLSQLYEELEPIPDDLPHPGVETLRWLQQHQIKTIYTRDDVVAGLDIILGRPRLREFVEGMILAGFADDEVERMVTFDAVNSAVIRYYRIYLFDLDVLSEEDLWVYLSNMGPSKTALYRSRGRGAKEFALHLFGVAPLESTVTAAGDQVVRMVHERLFYLSGRSPSDEDASMLRHYTTALKQAAAVVGAGKGASHELKKLLDTIEITTDDDGIATFDQLISGADTAKNAAADDQHDTTGKKDGESVVDDDDIDEDLYDSVG